MRFNHSQIAEKTNCHYNTRNDFWKFKFDMADISDAKSTPIARAERLKRVRNLANLSRVEMCENSDLNLNTYKGWEVAKFGGLSKIGAARVVIRLAKAGVTCTADWLLYEMGTSPEVNLMISEIESEATAEPVFAKDKQKTLMTEELLLFRSHYPKSLDYVVVDDSMLPHFAVGDIVAGAKIKEMIDGLDEYAIVVLENGKELLRKILRSGVPGYFSLVATNLQSSAEDLMLPNVHVNSMAPVIWHRRLLQNKL